MVILCIIPLPLIYLCPRYTFSLYPIYLLYPIHLLYLIYHLYPIHPLYSIYSKDITSVPGWGSPGIPFLQFNMFPRRHGVFGDHSTIHHHGLNYRRRSRPTRNRSQEGRESHYHRVVLNVHILFNWKINLKFPIGLY